MLLPISRPKMDEFKILVNLHEVDHQDVYPIGSILLDENNYDFDYFKSKASQYYEIETDKMKGFYLSLSNSLIIEDEVWEEWVDRLVKCVFSEFHFCCVTQDEWKSRKISGLGYQNKIRAFDAKFDQIRNRIN